MRISHYNVTVFSIFRSIENRSIYKITFETKSKSFIVVNFHRREKYIDCYFYLNFAEIISNNSCIYTSNLCAKYILKHYYDPKTDFKYGNPAETIYKVISKMIEKTGSY